MKKLGWIAGSGTLALMLVVLAIVFCVRAALAADDGDTVGQPAAKASVAALAADDSGTVDQPAANASVHEHTSMVALAIALVVGASCIGAGYAVGKVGSAALGAASERPEMLGRSLIFVGLAEGIAIYGLIIAIMLLNYMTV